MEFIYEKLEGKGGCVAIYNAIIRYSQVKKLSAVISFPFISVWVLFHFRV